MGGRLLGLIPMPDEIIVGRSRKKNKATRADKKGLAAACGRGFLLPVMCSYSLPKEITNRPIAGLLLTTSGHAGIRVSLFRYGRVCVPSRRPSSSFVGIASIDGLPIVLMPYEGLSFLLRCTEEIQAGIMACICPTNGLGAVTVHGMQEGDEVTHRLEKEIGS